LTFRLSADYHTILCLCEGVFQPSVSCNIPAYLLDVSALATVIVLMKFL
jgi:hypothetical protein